MAVKFQIIPKNEIIPRIATRRRWTREFYKQISDLTMDDALQIDINKFFNWINGGIKLSSVIQSIRSTAKTWEE
jgi:hypothetical protein